MESLYKRRVYESMRKKKAAASKKKQQIGLSARLLDDSDEESCASTTSISSESEYQNEDSSGTERTPDSDEDQSSSGGDASESAGKRAAPASQSRRKRSTLPESSSESDSDVGSKPARKVVPRKRIKIQSPASDSDVDEAAQKEKLAAEAKETAAKRKKRQNKLLALSKKMKSRITNRRRRRKDSGDEEDASKDSEDGSEKDDAENGDNDDDAENEKARPVERLRGSSDDDDELKDSDSLKDFIVEDEAKKGDKDEENSEPDDAAVALPRQFVTGSQLTHFQVVVKALLINVLDETFLKSLYSGERTKRYAQEMKTSLFHFDERMVLPRLENLKQRSRWTDRYKERVECYPKVRLVTITTLELVTVCEACQLQRQCSVNVKLSGQLYDNNTLQEDHFMPNDTQTFSVGSVCASRTEVYHTLKHFKYHLFQHCRTVLEEEKSGEKEEAVKDTVNRVFVKLQDGGWITEQYEKFQDHINDADLFQEEKLD